ncbi:redoxin domain-containing protein [Ruficoccus amylovorans]|uniref:Redoxin domain-containing protein n=1 Tax=Ruficoccus amylovorans TaxID=1804625 RepID=A0A842HEV0_9BACT|nr:redoxin domain-containing protein [Ruficoccus amylovorans]MBC2594568.1 redoxin domain-containing protein [Ruficoccus amylovorans]
MALAKGSKAPDFTLNTKTADGLKEVTLSDNFGKKKTVLLFFPFAFTSVCQNEMCSISAGMDEYEKLDAAVYGISVDSPFAQEGWAKANKISVTLLSDFNKEVATAYDVLYSDLLGLKGVAKRSAFVVDKDGTVTFSWSSEDPHDLPPFDEVKAALK